jgi:hypothetical protein
MVGASGYRPSRNRGISGGGRRIPFISNTSGASGRQNDPIFCKLCGHSMYKVESFHALVCDNCGAMDDLPLTEQEIRAKQQQESTFSIADGSIIYNQDAYSDNNLRQQKHYTSPGGITRKMPSVEDKFRHTEKSDAEKIMDYESDKLVADSYGSIKITGRVDEVNRSSDILSGEDFAFSKGNVDISSSSSNSTGSPPNRRVKRRFS